MQSKEKKKQAIVDLSQMKKKIVHHKDEIVDFLASTQTHERNEMDLTIDD